jgi:hypothetical protein
MNGQLRPTAAGTGRSTGRGTTVPLTLQRTDRRRLVDKIQDLFAGMRQYGTLGLA